jgi:hypothetical protein
MSEQQTTQSEDTQTSTPAESTLDDVYSKYNVEDTAQEFKAQPEQRPAPQQQFQPQPVQPVQDQHISIPDPTLDPAGYKNWATDQQRNLGALRQALQGVAGEIQKERIARAQAAEEADIKRAVDKVNQHLGDSKLDPDVVEISLGAEARRDPRFLALWNNRAKNPKAFEEGMKAFSSKLAKKFAMRVDPQIAENQRALKEATSTKATTAAEESETDRIGKLTGAAFEQALNKYRGTY